MEHPRPLGLVRQKLVFHIGNLAHMRLSSWPGYLSYKLRVARAGEFASFWKTLSRSKKETVRSPGLPSNEADVQELNDRAAAAYRPKPFGGRVTLFKPRVNYDFYPDPKMGWGDLVTGGLETVELRVNPHAMLVEGYVQELARELRRRLDEVREGGPGRAGP